MADIIAVMGQSGSGKSRSLLNLDPSSTYLIQVIRKRLPFRGGEANYQQSTKEKQGNRKIVFENPISPDAYNADKQFFFKKIKEMTDAMKLVSDKLPHIKTMIIDDSQYLMAYEYIARSRETGYEKYSHIGANFMNVLSTAQSLREDMVVVFLHHTEVDDKRLKMKTVGKLLDNYVSIEGLFETVLLAECRRNNGRTEYFFSTQTDGASTAKSPEGMFKDEEPNDLQLILNKYQEYYHGS